MKKLFISSTIKDYTSFEHTLDIREQNLREFLKKHPKTRLSKKQAELMGKILERYSGVVGEL